MPLFGKNLSGKPKERQVLCFMKKIIVVLLIMAMATSSYMAVYADDIIVQLDSRILTFDQPPTIINDRVMVPFRKIFEELGAEISWNQVTQTVTAIKSGTTIELTIGKEEAFINGVKKELDQPAVLINGRTLVPLRFAGEGLGATVSWDDISRKVSISTVPEEVAKALNELDAQFGEDVLDYILSLYDPESGGFYYSASARDNPGYLPDLESTGRVHNLLNITGAMPIDKQMELYPKTLTDKFVSFVQNMQDPSDGFFYHPQWGKNVNETRKLRDVSSAKLVLDLFSAKPLYDLPAERLAAEEDAPIETTAVATDAVPEYLSSEEALVDWINSQTWGTNPYGAAHIVSTAMGMIKTAGYMDAAIRTLNALQNTETGLWGEGVNYNTISAATKASYFYKDAGIPYPHYEKMLDNVIAVILSDDNPTMITHVYNPWGLIERANSTYGTNMPAELKKKLNDALPGMIRKSISKFDVFRAPDGILAYAPGGQSTTQGVNVSPFGTWEGDIGGVSLAINGARGNIYAVVGVAPPPLFEGLSDKVVQTLVNAPKIVKKEIEVGCSIDFEDMAVGKAPSGDRFITAYNALVTADPHNSRNKVLQLTNSPDLRGTVIISANSGTAKTIVTEYKIMISDVASKDLVIATVGQDSRAVQWCLRNAGGKIELYRRETDSGGTTLATINADEWYTLRIEYTPNGLTDTEVAFYLDGELIEKTNQYYNGGKTTKQPVTEVDGFRFNAFKNGNFTLYVDDITMTTK